MKKIFSACLIFILFWTVAPGGFVLAQENLLNPPKHIYVSLKYQELRYYSGSSVVDDLLISSGIPGKDTPTGQFSVLAKKPSVLFAGSDYYYPNTRWNLNFLPGYYIHGAYWHNNFGHKMSHGCVNVSYANMEPLYNWAEVGTPVTIFAGDFPDNLAMNFPSHTLLLDSGTIYLIMSGKKYGFTNMNVFTTLGYSTGALKRRSSTGIVWGGVLSDPFLPHLPGSWIIRDGTIYYVHPNGLVPITTWEIFLSNSKNLVPILRANVQDMAKPQLSPMVWQDQRVIN